MTTLNPQTATVLVNIEICLTHAAPEAGSAATSCCGHTPFELKRTDRVTNDAALVTCPGAWLGKR